MNILDGMEIFSTLSEQERENLSYFCQEKYIKEGEVLFREGDEANVMYILKTGEFEVSKNIDGEKVSLGKVKPEEVLGEMALFLETNERMATAIATKDSILITILSFSVLELSKKNPQLLEKIRAIIDNRVARNNAKEKNDF